MVLVSPAAAGTLIKPCLEKKKKKKEEKKHIGSDIIPAATYSSEKHRGYTGGKKETENSAERSRF